MKTTQYWTTFTANDDMTREVLAVRIVYQVSDDNTTTRAEVPALGIVIENDARALLLAIGASQREVMRRYAHLDLRLGAMTVAWCSETRPLLWADGEESIADPAKYQSLWDHPRKRWHVLQPLSAIYPN